MLLLVTSRLGHTPCSRPPPSNSRVLPSELITVLSSLLQLAVVWDFCFRYLMIFALFPLAFCLYVCVCCQSTFAVF